MGNSSSRRRRNRSCKKHLSFLKKEFGVSMEHMVTLSVNKLPENTFEEDLKRALNKVVRVEAVHVNVIYETRTISSDGFIVVTLKRAEKLLTKSVTFKGQKLQLGMRCFMTKWVYDLIKKKQEYLPPVSNWLRDVRPGHPDYRLPESNDQPFDLSPPEVDRPSAHSLVDDVLFLIFKNLNVQELLKIERTCLRWQWMVHQILGGHKFINFADKSTIWGDYGVNQDEYHHSLVIQKMFILNGRTMEHLIVDMPHVDLDNFKRAIDNCAPKLKHVFQLRKLMLIGHRVIYLPLDRSYLPPGTSDREQMYRHSDNFVWEDTNGALNCVCIQYMNKTGNVRILNKRSCRKFILGPSMC